MPLPPLRDPGSAFKRAWTTLRIAPLASFLASSLISFNGAQTASVVLLPVSPKTFRTFNRWCANTWWGWCVKAARQQYGIELVITGDDVPMRENAIVTINHQNMADITFMMDFAFRKDRLGDMKWIVKDIIKYVPGVGWGMLFLDCVFVKRDWAKDEGSIKDTFARLQDNKVPLWLLAFPEGTRITPEKLEQSQSYAKAQEREEPQHVLIPRTKGFVATVIGLRDHVTAIYDVTIGYEEGVPTIAQFVKGYARRCHLHVRRYAIEDIPTDEKGISKWIIERFTEKDRLLNHFYVEGCFPEKLELEPSDEEA